MAELETRETPEPEGFAYRAFLSYSHRDQEIAKRLHREVESYRIPAKLVGKVTSVGKVPRRLRPIFRDREELPASGDLSAELSAALSLSMFLVVICSPASAKSRWVNEEILQFKRIHGDGRVLALVVDGEPNATAMPGMAHRECFPHALRFRMGADGQLSDVPAEPIAADYRREADGRRLATQKLIAGLTGLRLDELVQRETQRRIARATAVASVAVGGMVVTGGLAFYANTLRIEANAQRVIAQQEAAAAQAAADFLVGTFELSNPATDNPRTITALTILSRSADRARVDLADQPVIQARLIATLARAYTNLSLFPQARAAIEASMPAITRAGPDGARALLVLSSVQAQQGEFDSALATVTRATQLLGPDLTSRPEIRAQAELTRGRIYTSTTNVKAATAAFDRALAFYRLNSKTTPREMAVALNNRGLALSDDGRFDEAEASLTEALQLYRKSLGKNHLSTGKAWYALAQNSYNAGKLEVARRQVAEALRIQRGVLDADNAILGDTLSMQGQILEGLNLQSLAESSLREAVGIYRAAYAGPHYRIGIAQVYLALIESERGNTAAALATLADAKANYDASYGKIHPNHGDLLVNRAKVLARAGRRAEARSDCAAGLTILRDTLGAGSSFTRSMEKSCTDIEATAPVHPVKAAAR